MSVNVSVLFSSWPESKKQERIMYFKSIGRTSNFVGGEFAIKDQKILVLFKSASGPAMS